MSTKDRQILFSLVMASSCFTAGFLVVVVLLVVAAVRGEPLTVGEAEQRIQQQARDALQPAPSMRGWKRDQVAATTAMALDWYSTKRGFDRGLVEGNPIYAWVDNDATELLAAMVVVRGLLAWVDRRSYKNGYPGWARTGAMIETGAHLFAVGWNESQ